MKETTMKMLLLIAHGSRREASNQEVREIARRLEAVSAGSCAAVMPAFLELAEPSIQDGVRLCSEAGATEVTVIPYFLSAGRHVAEDIPRELEEASRQHPQLHIQLREHIGAHREMPQLLLKSALGEQAAG
jgi:sirohydrochlorin ferrochelatase